MTANGPEIAIIGAGPAGLSAALNAARAGHSVVVLEAEEGVGGMSASFVVAGQRVDFGSHRLHRATDPTHLGLLRELLGDDLQTRTRNGRIRLDRSWVAFPLRPVDMLRHLPKKFAARAAFDAVTGGPRRPSADTFAAQIRAGLGPAVAQAFYEPYALKLWGTPASALDGELARRRVSAGSARDVLAKLVKGTQPGGREFLYPRLSYGQICESLANAAVDAGAEIRLSTPVTGLDLRTDRTEVRTGAASSATEPLSPGMVWSTAPVGVIAQVTEPGPPPEVTQALAQLRYRAMVLVYLVCDQDRYTPFDAHYFPGLDTPIARLSEPKNYRDGPDPEGQTVLCAELACWPDDDTWLASDAELGEIVAASLEEQGLPAPQVRSVVTRRLPRVYPVYPVGVRELIAPVLEWTESLERFVNFGRQGLFVPDNLHHCLEMGSAAAAAMRSDGSFDRRRWARSVDDFASHVVED